MSLHILQSYSTDPYYNLALEDLILRDELIQNDILILYKNDPCLVLGNFQCLWKEAPSEAIKKYHLKIVRRQSGGGTVYHDHGNLNFSFIFQKEKYAKNGLSYLLKDYFGSLGLQVESSGRDDFGVLDRESKTFYKFSGQAFKQTRNKVLHHGTLLFDSDLNILNEICMPNTKVKSKSVDSVVSKVTNLKSLSEISSKVDNIQVFQDHLVEYLMAEKQSVHFKDLDFDREILERKASELAQWETVFGKTPKFEFPFSYDQQTDTEPIIFHVHHAKIVEVQVADNEPYKKFLEQMVGLSLRLNDFERYLEQFLKTFSSSEDGNFVKLKTALIHQLFIA